MTSISKATGAGVSAANPRFVHLRVHTAYSLLEGAIPVKTLPGLCAAAHMPACAIADSDNLFGALEFSETMAKAGVQPIIGVALGLDMGIEETAQPTRRARRAEIGRVVLLAQSEAGYGALMRLVSAAYADFDGARAPHVTRDLLARDNEGLILLTGGARGPMGRAIADGRPEAARAAFEDLAGMFRDRCYVEIQRHDMAEERQTEPDFIEAAYDLGLPVVATNECYFATRDMFEAHDALMCVAGGAYVDQEDRRRLTPDHAFRSQEDMISAFSDLPEAIDMTVEIARRCAYRPRTRAPILPRFTSRDGLDEAEELRRQAREGLAQRLADAPHEAPDADYAARLEYELDVIASMGFPGYFLIVADFIKWAKANDVPVGPGRGSGAGSVAAWALTITDLDPLRFGLLFERFLNPERVSMPDFDIDFCQDRRDEVISYVQEKYGFDRVAQIITFGKLQARAVLRDVGRVLQMPYGQVDRLCKLVPNNPANPVTLAQAIAGEARLQEARDAEPAVARLLDVAQKLEGLYRHASTHAAGVVIGDRRLDALTPLYRDPRSGMPVTQFNMKWVEPAGLVKFDFLGLRTLTVIKTAADLINKTAPVPINPAKLPLDDPAAYEMLGRGDSTGVFQLESSGMRDVLRKLKPDCIEDIIALVALYRPGPMDNIPKYIACKNGDEPPDYLHPWLEDVLRETYGVIIYQEQVMQIAQILSGYSLGEADLLRRAMGKKIKSEMDKQKKRFIDGAVEKGVDKARADVIFELVAKFAGYGFNKSHAAAYALLSYQTAWLRANHPVAFMAATMTLDLQNTDKLAMLKQDLDRMRIRVLPPDINASAAEFSVEGDAIRYALGAIKSVGHAAMREVVEERTRNGPFASLVDFARRINPKLLNKRAFETLARAGAFDSLDPNRRRAFESAELLTAYAARAAEERDSKQLSMFADDAVAHAPPPRLANVRDWPAMERLAEEFAAIGFYLTAHPLDDSMTALQRIGVRRYADLLSMASADARSAQVAGVVTARQERRSAKGNRFAFVQLSDPTGVFEVMVFAESLAAHRDLLEVGQLITAFVEVDRDGDALKLRLASCRSLQQAVADAAQGVVVSVNQPEALAVVRDQLEQSGRGRGLVRLMLLTGGDGDDVELELRDRYRVTPQLLNAVRAAPGVAAVREL